MQAQLLKQSVNNQQSQLLIHELISVSIYCVTFLRDVFEENNYIDTKYYNERYPRPDSNYIRTKRLRRGVTNFADSIIKCVDEGIKDSIEKEYLKAVSFAIQLPNDCGFTVCENYLFGIDYLTNQVSFSINNMETEIEMLDYDQIISQIQGMIKRLIVLTQTFDVLPRKKSVLIKLLFNDSCPPDYQPPHFEDATDLPPTTIKVNKETGVNDLGSVNTGNNQVKLSILIADKDGVNSTDIDPFEFFNNSNDSIIGDVPASSLHLDSFLETSKNETAAPTQYLSHISPTCQKCDTKLNVVEYGYSKPLKRPLTCIKCMFGSEIDKDLLVLQKIRLLWDYLCLHEFPSTNSLLALTNLTLNDGDILRRVLNNLFQENVLVVTKEGQFESGTVNYHIGSGEFAPIVEGIIDNYGTPMVKNRRYFVIFVPVMRERFPYLSYDESVVDLYFPNIQLPRVNFVKLNLKKFKARCLQRETQFSARIVRTVIPDSQASTGVVKKYGGYKIPRIVDEETADESKDEIDLDASSLGYTAQEKPGNTIAETTKQIKDLSFADSMVILSQEPLPVRTEEVISVPSLSKRKVQQQSQEVRKKRKVSINKA
ncbi:hypothetical protein CANMA_004563 [Candida margitis]|uniref:uncharacterized protein n=1 Tax=Candida margitis TaxID=1775924 RepID=UPI002225BEDF|nr:uncharacterized protein CANMA_004545 [Candida margitis]XP_051669870.1 uncharacterized protein CANMA_004563 [Candida margitis]KAI5956116.1 hypothetical protein CANMA_004545 [Candida margitis]KAI5956134.1 hypothetical protein CANMA_004563 [Candida margitis]